MSCWVLNSGTLLGTGNVDIGVHFRTFSVCAVCLEIVGIPPFWHEKGLPDFSENPQGGVRGIRIAVRYIGFISMFYGCYSSETMKSIPICIPIISVKIDVVHRREYCVFCG